MDIAVLTAFLAPFLPFLTKLGEKAAEGAADQLGKDAWEKAKAIWKKLHPKVEQKESAKEAVADVANDPKNKNLQIVLQVQLEKLLKDGKLAQEIAQIMSEDTPDGTSGMQTIQTILDNHGVVSGQMSGGTAIGSIYQK